MTTRSRVVLIGYFIIALLYFGGRYYRFLKTYERPIQVIEKVK